MSNNWLQPLLFLLFTPNFAFLLRQQTTYNLKTGLGIEIETTHKKGQLFFVDEFLFI